MIEDSATYPLQMLPGEAHELSPPRSEDGVGEAVLIHAPSLRSKVAVPMHVAQVYVVELLRLSAALTSDRIEKRPQSHECPMSGPIRLKNGQSPGGKEVRQGTACPNGTEVALWQ